MRIIAPRTLRDFWEAGHANAEQPLRAWLDDVRKAEWTGMAEVKRRFPSASVVDGERVVFNIGGNNYRLVVKVFFPARIVYIKFIDTHAEYDKIDVTSL